ncbi:MAG TPA: acetyl-CoA carboxylase, biotin carboxyl carrier protein [Firmicutes bacterium]|nr:acetyl-CoA carboxylase, biotin carboxyl carrier protein [Bacillota bacterium]
MEFEQIKELISLVHSTDITNVEIEQKDFRLCIRKERPVEKAPVIQVVQPENAIEPVIPVSSGHGLVEIVAPMVGTFYRAPAPQEPPFIKSGDSIAPGQVLFIIEAMKMMNEIEAEIKGVVKEILVENGEPVEYGQPLLLVEPRK